MSAPVVHLDPEQLAELAEQIAARLRDPAPALLDRRGAAAYLKMGVSTFTRLVRPFVNVVASGGGRPLYRPEDLDRWAAARSRPVPPRGCRARIE